MNTLVLRKNSVFGKFLEFGGMDADDSRNTLCTVFKCILWAIIKAALMLAVVVFVFKTGYELVVDVWYFCTGQRDISEVHAFSGFVIFMVTVIGMLLLMAAVVLLLVVLCYYLYGYLREAYLRWLAPLLQPIKKRLCVRIVFTRK